MLSFASDLLFRKQTPPAKPDPQTEDFRGIANVTGKVRGHANGVINFGDAAPAGTHNLVKKNNNAIALKNKQKQFNSLLEQLQCLMVTLKVQLVAIFLLAPKKSEVCQM
ncbi:hypothetical protein L6164_013142 [Bauhinia variegata]|uniref:Uncharacterized protein n=1 Tax=Bauhinia variegata TaxID=167791 RepID=A0ACB9PBF6_BAUVA|nr:hypothetical protein L6164_013142 [Bauhinia variegata]